MNREKRIAVWVAALVMVLVAWRLFGQGFGSFSRDQPFLAGNAAASTDHFEALAYQWVFSDLDTNEATVTNWVDRIQSLALTNGNTGARPVCHTNGVNFENQWLTNTFAGVGTNVAFGFIVSFSSVAGNGGVRPGLLMNNADLGGDGNQVMGYCFGWSTEPLSWQGGGIIYDWTAAPYPLENDWHTLVVDHVLTNDVTPNMAFIYTNSVLCSSNNQEGAYWGDSHVPNKPNILGYNWGRNASPYFRLRELWVWTNAGNYGIPLRTVTRSNFHYYATNTYGFSP